MSKILDLVHKGLLHDNERRLRFDALELRFGPKTHK